MNNTKNRYNEELDNKLLLEESGSKRTRLNLCIIYAISNDGEMMTQSDKKSTFSKLESSLQMFSH